MLGIRVIDVAMAGSKANLTPPAERAHDPCT